MRISLNPLRTFGFLLRDTNRRYTQRFEQRAAVLGLTLPQSKVLIYLASREGISQVQLAELTDLEPMTLVRSLDFLESQGWLERCNDPADRRARRLYLKDPGKSLVAEIWNLVELTHREAFAGIPRKDVDFLIDVLEKVRSNVASLEPIADPSAVESAQGSRGKARASRGRRDRAAVQS